MRSKPLFAIAALAVIGCVFIHGSNAASQTRALTDSGPVAQLVYQNAATIHDLQMEINRLEDSQIAQDVNLVAMTTRITALEVTLAAHDKILWIVVTGLIGLFLELGVRLLARANKPE